MAFEYKSAWQFFFSEKYDELKDEYKQSPEKESLSEHIRSLWKSCGNREKYIELEQAHILGYRENHPEACPITGKYWNIAEANECVVCGMELKTPDDEYAQRTFMHMNCLILDQQATIQKLRQALKI